MRAAARLFSTTRKVDLRSDTVTVPLQKMRMVMAEAEVGDDIYAEDPTINALQARVAKLFNKEAALFTPTGTMANLLSVMSYCGPGDQVLLGDLCHVIYYEQGGVASLGGVMPRMVKNLEDGRLDLDHLKEQIMPDAMHYPRNKLVLLENTHNNCGGTVLPLDHVSEVAKVCKEHGMKLHIDGARILNAYYYHKKTHPSLLPHDLVKDADSLSLCFSKGLSCPIGSVITGSKEYIATALRWRKAVGGGMRQAGVLAAPAMVALDMAEGLLTADHDNAQILATGLKELGCSVMRVDTNIINFAPKKVSCLDFVKLLRQKDVLVGTKVGNAMIRAVTNSTVSREDVYLTLEKVKEVLGS